MKNNITEIIFILDESGSMDGLEKDTIGGFNSMIKKQKEQEGTCYISTVLFNGRSKVLYDRVELSKIKELTDKDYQPGGCTALLDAMGNAIQHVKKIHKYIREEDVPQSTMFVITTDGQENASKKYCSDAVKKMIKEQKEKAKWEFIFVGANIDAVETAKHYGFDEESAVNYHADELGTKVLYESLNDVVLNTRLGNKLKKEWSQNLQEDYEKRD